MYKKVKFSLNLTSSHIQIVLTVQYIFLDLFLCVFLIEIQTYSGYFYQFKALCRVDLHLLAQGTTWINVLFSFMCIFWLICADYF